MTRHRVLTDKELQQIAKLWNDGVRVADIGTRFSMTEDAVKCVAARHRDLMPKRVRNIGWHEGAVEKIVAMRSKGITLDAIAMEFGVSRTAVRKIAVQHGVNLHARKHESEKAAAPAREPSNIRKTEHITITGARISLPYVSFKVIGAEARA